MKFALKAIMLFAVGLFTATVVYPVLHEFGHSAAAITVGAEVTEFNLLPLPNILCDIAGTDNTGVVIIGFSGMTVPFLISALIKPKTFWIWYANYVLKGINALAFIIAVISSICFMTGNPVSNDDITQILALLSSGQYFCFFVSLGMVVPAIRTFLKEKPLDRCIRYFDEDIVKTANTL